MFVCAVIDMEEVQRVGIEDVDLVERSIQDVAEQRRSSGFLAERVDILPQGCEPLPRIVELGGMRERRHARVLELMAPFLGLDQGDLGLTQHETGLVERDLMTMLVSL
ncbi:MAG: hypothetical protein R3B96_22860 [Pirellulaceae bacterium]